VQDQYDFLRGFRSECIAQLHAALADVLGLVIEVTLDETFNQVEEKTFCRVVDSDDFTLKCVGKELEV
jgi:hypothetical protein